MKAVKIACLALVALLSFSAPAQADHGYSDTDILNFALNLEYLEANFYSWAAYGKGLDADLRGGGPEAIGGKKANLSPEIQAYAEEIADDEIAHVRFLRTALGDAAVPQPLIDIGCAFSDAADAALGTELDPRFDAYANDVFFLHAAYIFEDVGVTAYKGASPLVEDKAILEAAAGILAVESYHAAAVRLLLSQISNKKVPIYGAKVKDVVAAISNLRDAVDGPTDLDQGIVDENGQPNIVPTDENGICFSRTPAQVAAIVFLGDASMPGGFYPKSISATPGIVKLLAL